MTTLMSRRTTLRLERLENREVPDAKVAGLMPPMPAIAHQSTLTVQPISIVPLGAPQAKAGAPSPQANFGIGTHEAGAAPSQGKSASPTSHTISAMTYNSQAGVYNAYYATLYCPTWSPARQFAQTAYNHGTYG